MKRNLAIRSIAFLLVFVFIQKMGAGLYTHQLLHVQKGEKASAIPGESKVTAYSCSCIDDFAMPFTEIPAITVAPALSSFFKIYRPLFSEKVILSARLFNPLRGPPLS